MGFPVDIRVPIQGYGKNKKINPDRKIGENREQYRKRIRDEQKKTDTK